MIMTAMTEVNNDHATHLDHQVGDDVTHLDHQVGDDATHLNHQVGRLARLLTPPLLLHTRHSYYIFSLFKLALISFLCVSSRDYLSLLEFSYFMLTLLGCQYQTRCLYKTCCREISPPGRIGRQM